MKIIIEAWYNYPKGQNINGVLVEVSRDKKGRFLKVKLLNAQA